MGGASLAVAHLLHVGHRHIGYIGYIGATTRPLTNGKRLSGYTQTLEQAQIQIDPTWVVNPPVEDDIECGRLGVEHCLAAGVTAIVQPGGSIRDDEVIAAANQHRLAMVLTGVRHFRH